MQVTGAELLEQLERERKMNRALVRKLQLLEQPPAFLETESPDVTRHLSPQAATEGAPGEDEGMSSRPRHRRSMSVTSSYPSFMRKLKQWRGVLPTIC